MGHPGSHLLVVAALAAACAAAPPAEAPDAGSPPDAGVSAPPYLPASAYCEHIVDAFCPFYLRCGRIVAADLAECRRVFAETCETKYEPRYGELAASGLVKLSTAGLARCAAHLGTVACEAQPFDLAGPCAGMWEGTQPPGSPCGLDIESLVCAPGGVCRLNQTFCGNCVAEAADGEPCGADHGGAACAGDSECREGKCAVRPDLAEACDASRHCRLGLSCSGGVCAGSSYVPAGTSCDQGRRCAYRSSCIHGVCVESALLGESCGAERACASGTCGPDGTCVPPLADGAACTTSPPCLSGVCLGGRCESIPGHCIVR